jgi:hypothetical protein
LFTQLAIVIPTRNRSELALRSALSALQCTAAVTVLISDNSTEAEHSAKIRAFVAEQRRDNIRVVAPASPLSMTDHWEWAINIAQDSTAASHFLFLTDRMSFRAGQLGSLIGILRRYPAEVVSYTLDRIEDFTVPVRYRPLPRTGMLFRIQSARLLAASARMSIPSCLPRMLNCAVPRRHLHDSKARFGTVFASISPDFCFCYRCLDLNRSILYYDKSILLNYALDRSNGASISRGTPSKDSRDFIANLGATGLNPHSPLPAVITVGNAVINEYNFVRGQSASGAFPQVAMARYLDHLAGEILNFLDNGFRRETLDRLRNAGWKPTLRFRWKQLAARATATIVALREYRFLTTADAIAYADRHHPVDFFFKSALARRYGPEHMPLPPADISDGDQRDDSSSSNTSAT